MNKINVVTATTLKAFLVEIKDILTEIQDYAQVAQGLTLSEMKKQFTPNEKWVIERCQHFIKQVNISQTQKSVSVAYQNSINITTQVKNRKVADLIAMRDVIRTAQEIQTQLEAEGYYVYTLLTDGGQIIKVYKEEKESEAVNRLVYELNQLQENMTDIQMDTLKNKVTTINEKKNAIELLKKQAEAMGISAKFDM